LTQVACKQLVGLYLSVWARKRAARSMRAIETASAATGWGGYLGNKGAVAVRLRVHDAPLVVVCSHLASGDARGDEQRRNADVADIMRRCVFGSPGEQQQGAYTDRSVVEVTGDADADKARSAELCSCLVGSGYLSGQTRTGLSLVHKHASQSV
jgi:hypothetical protein